MFSTRWLYRISSAVGSDKLKFQTGHLIKSAMRIVGVKNPPSLQRIYEPTLVCDLKPRPPPVTSGGTKAEQTLIPVCCLYEEASQYENRNMFNGFKGIWGLLVCFMCL